MADLKPKIEELEKAAAECEVISNLALNSDVSRLYNDLAAGYADALKNPELIASEARVERGQTLVAGQRGIIARLEKAGLATGKAREFLSLLEESLTLLEEHRDRRSPPPSTDRWSVGSRVVKIGGQEFGTIVEANDAAGKIKVKWDNGATSYYYRDRRNIRLAD